MPRYDFGKFPKVEHQMMWASALSRIENKSNWSQWEKDFLQNIRNLVFNSIKLSEEQVWKLEQMYAKYTN